ncbi:esterase [Lithospermum erythrorhizon]|uniref:Esterase n=1 Tax=Lithospermum erythrorhizon TaxID=34254 RepID=A0AAV3PBW2_LITER
MGEDIAKLLEKKIIESNMMMKGEKINTKPKIHFVLVHGVGHGAWCWYKIKCLLEISGYKVSCPDLKGCGVDQTDVTKILSFDDYNKPLVDFLSSLPDDEQVILVGHSAGGLSVTDTIHKFGKKKIRLGVYIGATMLKTGFITQQDVIDGVPDFSELGELSDIYDIGFGLGPENPPTSLIVKKQWQRKLLYAMSPLEDVTLASILLRPGPIQALQSARFKEGGDIDKVPRVYIKTTNDRVVKPEQQENMIKKWQPSSVYAIETDHSPFFSAPFVLVGLLVQAANSSFGCSEIKGSM